MNGKQYKTKSYSAVCGLHRLIRVYIICSELLIRILKYSKLEKEEMQGDTKRKSHNQRTEPTSYTKTRRKHTGRTAYTLYSDNISTINNPASTLYKSIAGRNRPVSYPDGPITARYRFMKKCLLGSQLVM